MTAFYLRPSCLRSSQRFTPTTYSVASNRCYSKNAKSTSKRSSKKLRKMKIAVEGCSHGELDNIYRHIKEKETQENFKVDLLLLCGDFQAVRNVNDMQCMAVPDKYKDMKTFHKYYSGEKTAPLLTIVIGGNHEASNYMWELYHGGWLAPNIYFLGHSGVINVNGIRIAGASGIFNANHFSLGNYEKLPYNSGCMRSIYHIREFTIRKLSLLSPRPDIFLSHDWPQGIEQHGNLPGLLRHKPFFKRDIETGNLGSPPLTGLLHNLQPDRWFSAHLHTRFEASVPHFINTGETTAVPKNPDEIIIDSDEEMDSDQPSLPEISHTKENPEEITLSDEEADVEPPAPPPPHIDPPTFSHATEFLALDKCLPRRRFMEFLDIPTPNVNTGAEPAMSFDFEWLAISRAFHPYFSQTALQLPFPSYEDAQAMIAKETVWLSEQLAKNWTDEKTGQINVDIRELQKFVHTAPPQAKEGQLKVGRNTPQPPPYQNPQTEAFCQLIGVENKINP